MWYARFMESSQVRGAQNTLLKKRIAHFASGRGKQREQYNGSDGQYTELNYRFHKFKLELKIPKKED